jgi:ribosomal-protein-alanine N-acetyltransferase
MLKYYQIDYYKGLDEMSYKFIEMNNQYSKEIIDWHYDGNYSFYDMRADQEDLEEFMDSSNWPNKYFAVVDKNDELTGFFSFSFSNGKMSIGLGMKPSLTGIGLGEEFINMGIMFGIKHFSYTNDYITLDVASFNKRAIKVYERIGFKVIDYYNQNTNGGEYEFVRMRKRIDL